MRGATIGVGGLVAVLLAAGCISPIRKLDGSFRNRRNGFTIAAPAATGGPWKRISVDEADLAFTRPGPSSMSLQSRCGRPVAEAQLMARHLVIGLRDREVVSAGPVSVAGRSGWAQTFEYEEEGRRVRIKTVTLVAADCVFDWILVSRGSFDAAELEFDSWWQSLELDARFDEEAEETG